MYYNSCRSNGTVLYHEKKFRGIANPQVLYVVKVFLVKVPLTSVYIHIQRELMLLDLEAVFFIHLLKTPVIPN